MVNKDSIIGILIVLLLFFIKRKNDCTCEKENTIIDGNEENPNMDILRPEHDIETIERLTDTNATI